MTAINRLKNLGPGLLFAGAAIGVSHLVQSTRAGANYYFDLLWALALANIMKYPFFEMASRYTLSTNESVLKGYQRIGKFAVWSYVIITAFSMFTVQAAVTLVTASVLSNILDIGLNLIHLSILVLLTCAVILIVGQYNFLDRFIKIVIIVLSISTIFAAVFAVATFQGTEKIVPSVWDNQGILFLIAFMGWMPTTLDVGVWQSVWTLEKRKTQTFDFKTGIFDFRIGYIATAILAVFFLSLGAVLMFPSNEAFSSKGTEFSNQFISLYTNSMGKWSEVIIQIAALTAMFSTTLTVLDGYPRSLTHLVEIYTKKYDHKKLYWVFVLILSIGATLVLSAFISSLKGMVDLATTISFLATPFFAILNYLLFKQVKLEKDHQLTNRFKLFSLFSFIVILVFTVLYLSRII